MSNYNTFFSIIKDDNSNNVHPNTIKNIEKTYFLLGVEKTKGKGFLFNEINSKIIKNICLNSIIIFPNDMLITLSLFTISSSLLLNLLFSYSLSDISVSILFLKFKLKLSRLNFKSLFNEF